MAAPSSGSASTREDRHKHVLRMLQRPGPFAGGEFDQSFPYFAILEQAPILVVGAGGLGCELLKDLALLGFGNIHVIDMDTIDLSNLNRQFLFRPDDVGKDKAGIAAAFINKRIPDTKVTPHFKKIQDYGPDFYSQFAIIVCGLDSIPARRWINNMLISLVEYDADGNAKPETIKPLIDGGTEGFKGNARVILPGKSACVECSLDLYPPQVSIVFVCTASRYTHCQRHIFPTVRSNLIEFVLIESR
eukprot:m.170957 g.170957  ORF g.170957 m.170957 type:complete len:246 (-) comp18276_c1_seq1:1337-2074(-)